MPYTPGKIVLEFELAETTIFARADDGIDSFQQGRWFMKKEDIIGLIAAK